MPLVGTGHAGASLTLSLWVLRLPHATWRHVAVTYDGHALGVFLDGLPFAAAHIDGPIDLGGGDLVLGRSQPPGEGNPFDGAVDEVMLVGRALAPGVVASLAQLGPCAPVAVDADQSRACTAGHSTARASKTGHFTERTRNDGEVNSAAVASTRSPSLFR